MYTKLINTEIIYFT